jgi:hypothetical protein
MWYSFIVNTFFSVFIIFIIHQLWEYCKINYTTPKTKNVFDIKESKYRQMVEDMETRSVSTPPSPPKQPNDFLPPEEKEWINSELAAFINTI